MEEIGNAFHFLVDKLPGIALITFILIILIMYIQDRTQTLHPVRKNYPIIGRMRYFLEHVGIFMREYIVLNDSEGTPFSRAQRAWVYRAAKNISNKISFGSTKKPEAGDVIFANAIYFKEKKAPHGVVIGQHTANPLRYEKKIMISGMSFGALGDVAIESLAGGAAKSGILINTGEGGLTEMHKNSGAQIMFQIGTAKNSVSNEDGSLSYEKLKGIAQIENVKAFSIKISQGSKPGLGGILPGAKVTEEIAKVRGIPVGKDAISPSGFSEFSNDSELIQFIHSIRSTVEKPVGIKFCLGDKAHIESLLGSIKNFELTDEMRVEADQLGLSVPEYRLMHLSPDFIELDSGYGGTGAAPVVHMESVGMDIRESLPVLTNALRENGFDDRIKVIAIGRMLNPADVAWALCAGADFVGIARGFLFSLGCIQARECASGRCPTGIATHDPRLKKALDPALKINRVSNYANNLEEGIAELAMSCGLESADEFNRNHARMLMSRDKSIPLKDVYKDY